MLFDDSQSTKDLLLYTEQWLTLEIEVSIVSFTVAYFSGINTQLNIDRETGIKCRSKVPTKFRKAGESTTLIG